MYKTCICVWMCKYILYRPLISPGLLRKGHKWFCWSHMHTWSVTPTLSVLTVFSSSCRHSGWLPFLWLHWGLKKVTEELTRRGPWSRLAWGQDWGMVGMGVLSQKQQQTKTLRCCSVMGRSGEEQEHRPPCRTGWKVHQALAATPSHSSWDLSGATVGTGKREPLEGPLINGWWLPLRGCAKERNIFMGSFLPLLLCGPSGHKAEMGFYW